MNLGAKEAKLVGGSATPLLVASTLISGTTSAGITTAPIDTSGATLLVIAMPRASTEPVVSDSKGNTWTPVTAFGTDPVERFFYAANPIVGPGHTFTFGAAANSFSPLGVMAFSGVKAVLPFDVANGAGAGVASTTLQPGSVTPALDGSLIVSAFGFGTAVALPLAINSGFTLVQQVEETAGSFGAGLAYLIQGTAAAVNPTWTRQNSSTRSSAIIAVFKKA